MELTEAVERMGGAERRERDDMVVVDWICGGFEKEGVVVGLREDLVERIGPHFPRMDWSSCV